MVSGNGQRSPLVAAALLVVACASCTGTPRAPDSGASSRSPAVATSLVPQPSLPPGVPIAPDSKRVDLAVPTFTHPTRVTNPLFPVARQRSVLFTGHVDGKPFRTEVTLLPYTRWIEWGGQQIETLVSQYVAYSSGRLQEVAYDLYAQADDESVWYFGEDVVDLAHGDIVTKEGTWLAGKDGPAQMIMPGHPRVGDVFRTENIPGIAFEQVTVDSTDQPLTSPMRDAIIGMVGEELHEDGTTEHKLFAPGYGEYYTGGGGDVEALAQAVPTDAASGRLPSPLRGLRPAARRVFVAAGAGDWTRADQSQRQLRRALGQVRAEAVARRVLPELRRAGRILAEQVAARNKVAARRAAIQVQQWALDAELRYVDPVQVDRSRFALWADQLVVDADARSAPDVNGDVFTLFYLRDRVQQSLSPEERLELNEGIGALQELAFEHSLGKARGIAMRMSRLFAGSG